MSRSNLDSQQVEIVGTNFVVGQLIADGIEVARPVRDRGVDLVAYLDSEDQFVAVPVQVKAASGRSFGYWEKYAKTPGLAIIFVWEVADARSIAAFGLSHQDCVTLGTDERYNETASWTKGTYITTRPSRRLTEAMERFRLEPGGWRDFVRSLSGDLSCRGSVGPSVRS